MARIFSFPHDRRFAASALLLTLCIAAQAQSSYTVTAIPNGPGANYANPRAINNSWVIVGKTGSLPFVYRPGNASLTLLPLPAGAASGEAKSINNAGQIVGTAENRAVLWQSDAFGNYTAVMDFNTVPIPDGAGGYTTPAAQGWILNSAEAINEQGDILSGLNSGKCLLRPTGAGAYTITPIPNDGPTIWPLNDDTSGSSTLPQHGPQVVTSFGGQYCLWEWTTGGGYIKYTIPVPFNQGRGLNNWEQASDWGSHGHVYLPVSAYGLPTGTSELGTLGGYNMWTFGMNDAGQIVGYSNLKNGSTANAFVWADGKTTNLNSKLTNPRNWVLTIALAITNGTRPQNMIVGYGTYRNVTTGFYLTPHP